MSSVTVSSEGTLEVVETSALNPLVRLVRFASPSGAPLPQWSPGAHMMFQVSLPDGSTSWRHYSLIEFDRAQAQSDTGPMYYTIAVRREDNGRGGSQFMHDVLKAGDHIAVEGPVNNFELDIPTGTTVLLAGGIGITPLASMAAYCWDEGHPMKLYYAGRSRTFMAFEDKLGALLGSDMHVHVDDENAGQFFDAEAVLDACGTDDRLYVCGPKPMLDAVLAATEKRQWAPGRVRFEVFTEPVVEAGDHAFEVELAESGDSFVVPADQTLLDCLLERGHDPLYDCTRGECGICTTGVIEGEVDHRDYVLSQSEKDEGGVMQICVSRAKGDKLVLDM